MAFLQFLIFPLNRQSLLGDKDVESGTKTLSTINNTRVERPLIDKELISMKNKIIKTTENHFLSCIVIQVLVVHSTILTDDLFDKKNNQYFVFS